MHLVIATYGWFTRSRTVGTTSPDNGSPGCGPDPGVEYSMLVQKYDTGPVKGVLNVVGSIAERWRCATRVTVKRP